MQSQSFELVVPIEKAGVESDDGDWILSGPLSSERMDHQEERVLKSAIEAGLTVFRDYDRPVDYDHQSVRRGDVSFIIGKGIEEVLGPSASGGETYHLRTRLFKNNPVAKKCVDHLRSGGNLYYSIGGTATRDGKLVKSAKISHVAVTPYPANPDAKVGLEGLAKSLLGDDNTNFHPLEPLPLLAPLAAVSGLAPLPPGGAPANVVTIPLEKTVYHCPLPGPEDDELEREDEWQHRAVAKSCGPPGSDPCHGESGVDAQGKGQDPGEHSRSCSHCGCLMSGKVKTCPGCGCKMAKSFATGGYGKQRHMEVGPGGDYEERLGEYRTGRGAQADSGVDRHGHGKTASPRPERPMPKPRGTCPECGCPHYIKTASCQHCGAKMAKSQEGHLAALGAKHGAPAGVKCNHCGGTDMGTRKVPGGVRLACNNCGNLAGTRPGMGKSGAFAGLQAALAKSSLIPGTLDRMLERAKPPADPLSNHPAKVRRAVAEQMRAAKEHARRKKQGGYRIEKDAPPVGPAHARLAKMMTAGAGGGMGSVGGRALVPEDLEGGRRGKGKRRKMKGDIRQGQMGGGQAPAAVAKGISDLAWEVACLCQS